MTLTRGSGPLAPGSTAAWNPGVWADSDTRTHCPFKGDAAYLHLRAGQRSVDDLLWRYDDPLPAAPWLQGLGALYASKVDAWFVEEDRVVGHLRDPYHRVDAHPSTRRVVVRVGGEVAWSYDTPLPDALRAQAHLCFDTSVDGVEVELS